MTDALSDGEGKGYRNEREHWWCGACGVKNSAYDTEGRRRHRCSCGAPRPSDPAAAEAAARAKLEEPRTSPEKPLINTAFCDTPSGTGLSRPVDQAPPKKPYAPPTIEKTEPAPHATPRLLRDTPVTVIQVIATAETAQALVFELASTPGVVTVKVLQKQGRLA